MPDEGQNQDLDEFGLPREMSQQIAPSGNAATDKALEEARLRVEEEQRKKAQTDRNQQAQYAAGRYGAHVEINDNGDAVVTVDVDDLDTEQLRLLASELSSATGTTVTPEQVAANSFLKNAYETLPEGTLRALEQQYLPIVSQEQTASAATAKYNQWLAQKGPGTDDETERVAAWDRFMSESNAELTAQARQQFQDSITASIKNNLDAGKSALPQTDLLATLMRDAGKRDPLAALNFMEKYGNTALEQTLLPAVMRDIMANLVGPQAQGDLYGMAEREKELMKLMTEGNNLETFKKLIKDEWTKAGENLVIERNPLGEPLASKADLYWKQREAFNKAFRDKLPELAGTGTAELTGSENWTPQQWQSRVDRLNRAVRTFGYAAAPETENRVTGPAQAAIAKSQEDAEFDKMVKKLKPTQQGGTPRLVQRPVRGVYQ